MKRNVGNLDRILRVVLGILLIGNVFVGLHSPWGWIGVVLIVTALIGSCPVYSVIGVNTASWGERLRLK